ncbi:MAG: hypothetical protein ABSA03_19595 [Streptosporangiaceae bacterium]|jgi:hypothetical protein
MPGTRRRRGTSAAVALAVVVLLGGGAYLAFRHVAPLLARTSGCEITSHGQALRLAPSQAGIAATIAGVALREGLPRRAVTIAYAAALQESKLENLSYGDRDSVGVFQQRPSQGWGPARQLEDPVYATGKFFSALIQVPRYQEIAVYRAAQAVQRSADGTAYIQYEKMAASLSRGFTGDVPRAVWCWYPKPSGARARLGAASQQLARAFGPLPVRTAGDPRLTVIVARPAEGWSVAAWLVSHASGYGIADVRYGRFEWRAASGTSGWTRAPVPAPAGHVQVG